MPIYEYKCNSCGEIFEMFRAINTDDQKIKCPNCGSGNIRRLLSPVSNNHPKGQSCGINFPT